MSDKPPKQMKGFERKTTEAAPTPQFSTRDHRTHKSGISSPGQTTSDSDGYFFLYMIGINNICIVYFIWASKVSELRPSEPRIILLAESGDLDNHNAARRTNG